MIDAIARSVGATREPSNVNKIFAMDLLVREVNAAVRGVLDVAPSAVIHVLDGHGTMGINANLLHPRAELWLGRFPDPRAGLDESFEAMLFVGQHAMDGTPGAPLCHTYSSHDVKSYHLNGEEIGEFGSRTLLAASLGVPTIFLSGDDKAAAEAEAFQPGIVTVITKFGGGVEWARHLSPVTAREKIRAGARDAVRRLRGKRFPLVKRKAPYELVISLREGIDPAPWVKRGGKRARGNKVVFRSRSLLGLPI